MRWFGVDFFVPDTTISWRRQNRNCNRHVPHLHWHWQCLHCGHLVTSTKMVLTSNPQIWWLVLRHLFNSLEYLRRGVNLNVNNLILNSPARTATIINAIQVIWEIISKLQRRQERQRRRMNPHKLIRLLHGYRYATTEISINISVFF